MGGAVASLSLPRRRSNKREIILDMLDTRRCRRRLVATETRSLIAAIPGHARRALPPRVY